MNYEMRITAIRGAWQVARKAGIEPPAHYPQQFVGLMSHNEKVRLAMIAAWKAGYRYAKAQAKKEAGNG